MSEVDRMAQFASAWHLKPLDVRTERLHVRQFTVQDITPQYLAWLNDRHHMRFSNQRFVDHSTASAHDHLEKFSCSKDQFLAIDSANSLVGTATIYFSPHHGTADIGILVGVEYSGRGIGQECVAVVTTELFDQGVRKVTLGTSEANLPMQRLLEGLGFKEEGMRPRQEIVNGLECGLIYFAKYRQDRRPLRHKLDVD